MGLAFTYAQTSPLETEANYAYEGVDDTCRFDAAKGVAKTTGSKNVTPNSSADLKAAIAQGPVSVAIEADTFVFQFYNNGIFNSKSCGTNLDHGVLAVGYGNVGGKEYYIVKNSWGPSWGLSGFIQVAIVDGEGICGIQKEPVFPLV